MTVPIKTKTKALPQVICVGKTAVVKQTDTASTIRVLGVPYFGPDYLQGKDLQGEYFDKYTDYAMTPGTRVPMLEKILSYYDHAFHALFGSDPIGVAKFYAETEEGQWYDIEISRSFRYHDFLLQLAEKGALGASSQPVQTAVVIDYGSGHIEKWHSAEISLTPTPANPLAVASIAKLFDFDEAAIKTLTRPRPNVKTVTVDQDVPGMENDAEPEPETPDEAAADDEATEQSASLADTIESAFGDEDAPEVPPVDPVVPPAEPVQPVPPTVPDSPAATEDNPDGKALLEALTALTVKFDAFLTTYQTDVTAAGAARKGLLVKLSQIDSGIAAFAKNVAKQLKLNVREAAGALNQRSQVERAVAEKFEIEEDEEPPARTAPAKNTPYTGRSSSVPDTVPGRM